jgi:hypothetical protein
MSGSRCGRASLLSHRARRLHGLFGAFLLGDVEIAVVAAGDVVRPAHTGPRRGKSPAAENIWMRSLARSAVQSLPSAPIAIL